MKQKQVAKKNGKSTSKPKDKRSIIRFLLYCIFVVLFFAMLFFMIHVDKILKDEKIPLNVFFLNEHLGGMKKEVATTRIQEIMEAVENRQILISYKDSSWLFSPREAIDFTLEKKSVINRLLTIGAHGSFLSRIRVKLRLNTGRDQINLGSRYYYNKEKLRLFCELLAMNINRKPEPARVEEAGQYRKLVRERDGLKIDSKEMARQIVAVLENLTSYRTGHLFLKVERVKPEVDALSKLAQLKCTKTTTFSIPISLTDKRREKLQLAVEELDGVIIKEGHLFSLNGWLQSVNKGKLQFDQPEYGYFPETSGVDVLATALYNAAVLSGMDVTERNAHQHVDMENKYIEPGRDAMINFTDKDLKFRTRSKSYSVIQVWLSDRELQIEVYQSVPLPGTIKIRSRNLDFIEAHEETFIDRTMARGKRIVISEGIPGIQVTTEKVIIRSNEREDILPLFNDVYKAIERKVRVGDKAL